MLGVVLKCLVMTDEVVFDVTRITEIVLRSPVYVEMMCSTTSLFKNVLNKLFELQVIAGLQRSEKNIAFSAMTSAFPLISQKRPIHEMTNYIVIIIIIIIIILFARE